MYWEENILNKNILAIGIVILFIISTLTPIAIGYTIVNINGDFGLTGMGPKDTPWPMKCHDNRHTGLSPYSTANNPGIEKWRFKCKWVEGSAVIDDDGTIYFGDTWGNFFALNPDGTLKWEYDAERITSSPALAEDGTIYFGSWDTGLYALNPDGSQKWRTGSGGVITSSPAIAEDGTIYVGTMRGFDKGDIVAFYPNGTIKWIYVTGDSITSDSAIGDDGTIYIGSMDNYLYAMWPNGTLRWRFKTGDSVQGPASIADDGTIYIGSWDGYLYALYQNGSMKWKCGMGGTKTNPSLGNDGTIYVGGDKLHAINPDGTGKWYFDLGSERTYIADSCPAISADGTIYFGTHVVDDDGDEIIAVNPDGTERWRKHIADYWVDSSPCIGEDGTVYIGSTYNQGKGYLHAFGSVDSNAPPSTPLVEGTINGIIGEEYYYLFTSVDPDNNPVSYYVDWGDGTTTETMDWASGEEGYASHTYNTIGEYTIMAKARDTLGEESDWGTLSVTMPRNKNSDTLLLQLLDRFLGRFPLLTRLLSFGGVI